MTNIKNVLLASAFIVSVSTAANAVTIVDSNTGANANDLSGELTGTIGAGEVTNGNIATGAVNSASIADGTVTGTDIATGTITSGNIQDGTITSADLSTAVNNSIAANTAGVARLNNEVNDLKGGVASAIAIATIPGVPAGKQFAVGLGGGTYDGENAGALKLSFAPQSMQSVQVNGSVTFSDSNTGAGVGVSYGF